MLLHRRDAMLRLGQVGLGALTLPALLNAERASASDGRPSTSPSRRTHAKSCILLYLWGGPPQQDMWDLKPHTPQGIRTIFEPIQTAVPGIQLCDHMPMLARHTDKTAFI